MTVIRSSRLGPSLFALLGFACAYLGYWRPMWDDRQFGPEVDSRVGWVIAGFAPMVAITAGLAVYGFIRLWRLQRKEPNFVGRLLLVLLLPLVCFSVFTAILLGPATVAMLPAFVASVISAILGPSVGLFLHGHSVLFTVLIAFALAIWFLKRRKATKT